ncbi:MAG: hypothetical protein ACRC0E_01965 [Soonwooa sp.]
MKRILFLCMIALFAVSCSKKVKVNGVIKNGSPLERVEFIDASGVATLPLINMGVDAKGNFTGEFEAPKNGMYAMTYAGQMAFVYLKKGRLLIFREMRCLSRTSLQSKEMLRLIMIS